jgi:hypothetical protein
MPRRRTIRVEPAYRTTCDECELEGAGVDRTGHLLKHLKPGTAVTCPASGWRDLNPPSGDVFGIVPGGGVEQNRNTH